jgi:hypothetical protein
MYPAPLYLYFFGERVFVPATRVVPTKYNAPANPTTPDVVRLSPATPKAAPAADKPNAEVLTVALKFKSEFTIL